MITNVSCSTSPRVYVVGITKDNTQEFLHTFLDNKSAVNYIKTHHKTFKDRFYKYIYGPSCVDRQDWLSLYFLGEKP